MRRAEPVRNDNTPLTPASHDSPDVIDASGVSLGFSADPRRLSEHIRHFAQFSCTDRGVTRLAYTPTERRAHESFASQMRALGLEVITDPAGNTIAERPGHTPQLGSIGTGSHLDSVADAGRFDGIAGVASALEVARLVIENDLPHEHNLRFVAFAAEEGARFGQACIGSRFAAGLMSNWQLTGLTDRDNVTLAEAMQSVGFDANEAARTPWTERDWAAFVELHVEQGGVLEATGIDIGVVDLVSGSTRLRFHLTGQATHTGATPMHARRDALAAAAEIVLIAETLANDAQHRGSRTTVGQLEALPGSITTIAGKAMLSLDVRDIDSDRQRATATEIVRRAVAVCDRRRIHLSLTLLGDTSPVVLPIWLRLILAQTCQNAGVNYQVLTSGASHDSQLINKLTPAAIIFVPSRAGLSHVPEEWTSSSDLARGTSVLLSTLLRIDTELMNMSKLDPEKTPPR